MKLQQTPIKYDKGGYYFVYIPAATIRELGLKKGDEVSIEISKVEIKNVDSRKVR